MVYKLGKILIGIILLYLFWFKEAYMESSLVLYISTILLIVLFFLSIYLKKYKLNLKNSNSNYGIVKTFFIFGCYSLFTGFFLVKDRVLFYNQLFIFFSYTLICFFIYYFSADKNNFLWLLKTIVFIGVSCSIQTIIFPYYYSNGSVVVTTMSKTNNPNTLGLVSCFSIFSLGMLLVQRKIKIKSLFWGLNFLFIYIIILTGSRKCLFSGMFLMIYFFIDFFCGKKVSKNQILKIIPWVFSISIIILFMREKILYFYLNSSSFERLQLFFKSISENKRLKLYEDAILFWKVNPLFGIGFNQYRVFSIFRYYSHSTYAEILSCSGLVGIILFFTPFIFLIVKLIKVSFSKKYIYRNIYRYILIMIIVELFLGVGQIFIYDLFHMVILTYLFGESFNYLNKERKYANKKKNRKSCIVFG